MSKDAESIVVGILLCAFIAICLIVHNRYIPWTDEVQFVDPAANLYYKLGFVSREHSNQNDLSFWSANAPGYSMLLYVAFVVFHFSQTAPRVLNVITMALAALTLWAAVRRARLLSRPDTRLLMVVMVLTGYGCYTCYSNIRYDALCLLESALALFVYTISNSVFRNLSFFVLGAAMFLTNLQLPEYAILLLVIVTFACALGFRPAWKLRFLYLGAVAGGIALMTIYASHPGSLNAFRITLQQQVGQSLLVKLQDIPYYLQYDISLGAILLFMLVSLAVARNSVDSRARQSIIAGLLCCILIPAVFFFLRRYVFSLAWMAYVPAVLFLCRVIEARISEARAWKVFAAVCCAVSIVFGLPRALGGIFIDWHVRDYAVVEKFVEMSVEKNDVVFCAPAAYFAAKPRALRVYGPGYLDVINNDERKAIDLLIVAPVDEAEVVHSLGGKWRTIRTLDQDSAKAQGSRLLKTNFTCRLDVLRRAS